MATRFFKPTDATRVAGSPQIGVGPGFDSQGSVTFFHKYCFPNLHGSHWAIPWWSDSAIYSNIQVHKYTSTQTHEYTNPKIREYKNTKVHKYIEHFAGVGIAF